MIPLPSTRWCDTFLLGGVFGNLQFLPLASLLTCFQVLNFEISIKALENLARPWIREFVLRLSGGFVIFSHNLRSAPLITGSFIRKFSAL